MVDLVEEQLRRASHDKSVKAVILKVNSPGGEVLASDDIYNLIEKFQSKSGKPTFRTISGQRGLPRNPRPTAPRRNATTVG